MNVRMNVRELRLMTGLSQQKFADYFKIPLRTLQNWEYGEREAPEYVIELIKYKLEMEGLIMTSEYYMKGGNIYKGYFNPII